MHTAHAERQALEAHSDAPDISALPALPESMECQAFKSEQAALAWLAEQILGRIQIYSNTTAAWMYNIV